MSLNNQHPPTKVVILEDHQMFREWLAQVLIKKCGCDVRGQTDNIQDARKLIAAEQPDLVLVDLTVRGSSGLELIKDLRAEGVEIPILVLSMHDEHLYAERALRAGANGYVSKTEAASALEHAVRQVLSGKFHLSEEMTYTVLDRISARKSSPAPTALQVLADRELEVFQLLGRGFTSQKIAELLHLGEATVNTYRQRIREKLHLRNSAELYSKAAQWLHRAGGSN